MKRLLIILLLLPIALGAKPLTKQQITRVDSIMNAGVAKGYYPGASIAIGDSRQVQYAKCYGYTDSHRTRKVTPDDVYDLASCTKVVATTFAVMRLYDRHLIDLNKTVGDYISTYDDTPLHDITIAQLLTHTSGLSDLLVYPLVFYNPDGERLASRKYHATHFPRRVDTSVWICSNPMCDTLYISPTPIEGYRRGGEKLYINPAVDTVIVRAAADSFREASRGKYIYSDVNFMILRQIVEKLAGVPFAEYCDSLFREMDMRDTGFTPLAWKDADHIIPTEYDHLLGRGLVVGYPHDELASLAPSGAEGSAGLFSTAADLARFCRMMLRGGEIDGNRILLPSTVALFTSMPLAVNKIYRSYGFDRMKPDSPLWNGYGHTGYTGTIIWVDPASDLFMVFLSNRVHPTRINTGLIRSSLRTRLWEIVK